MRTTQRLVLENARLERENAALRTAQETRVAESSINYLEDMRHWYPSRRWG